MAGIPVEWCVGAREVGEPRLSPDGSRLGVVLTVDGVSSIDVWDLDAPGRAAAGPVRAVHTPAPRAGRGLGGGGWTWSATGDAIVYAAGDGNLWWQALDGGPARPLTDHGPDRAAQAPAMGPDGALVAYVVDQAEVWVADLRDGRTPTRIDDGSADFCFDPVVLPDGSTVVWHAWNVPDMPWDASRLERLDLRSGTRTTVRPVGSVQQPRPLPDGRLVSVRDDEGWANLWLDDRPLVRELFEHAGPTWGLGQRSFAIAPDGLRIAFHRNERGFGRLCVVDVGSGAVEEVARGVHGQLSWCGERIAAIRTGARTPTQVVVYEPQASGERARRVIVVGPRDEWRDAPLAEPELVTVAVVPTAGGGDPRAAASGGSDDSEDAVVHARLYRADPPAPTASATAASATAPEPPKMICWLHGGPTDQWQVTFMPRIAYWRSLGWNVLVPDHRGSTGHGRRYQQALRGRWGELDVADTVAVLRAAYERGWGTPDRTVLIGGSAGGFTVLNVLAASTHDDPVAAAGVVAYPVSDLDDLAERSHRFERHYTDSLVGPKGSPTMRERSPIWFAQRIRCPLLVFHGELDPVVPVEQSRVLVGRMRAAGSEVELIEYPGEGHGFRLAEHQLDEYAHTAAFLTRALRRGR